MGSPWVPRTTLGFPFSHCIVRFGSHDANICKCTDSFFTQKSLVTRKPLIPDSSICSLWPPFKDFHQLLMDIILNKGTCHTTQDKANQNCKACPNSMQFSWALHGVKPDYVLHKSQRGFFVTISKTILLN